MNKKHLSSHIEPLEARIAPAAVFSFTDVDGDHVTIKTSRGGNFDLMNAATIVGGQLQTLDLSIATFGGEFQGGTVSITAERAGNGDGHVNVGYINAVGQDLGAVTVDGDLGRIDAGDAKLTTAGLGSLKVISMGALGTATQAPGGTFNSTIAGDAGGISVLGDMHGENFSINGSLPFAKIGGAVLDGGFVVFGKLGSVSIGGDLAGSTPGTGRITASDLGNVTIGGSLIGGPILAGSISSGHHIGAVRIGGSIHSGLGDFSGTIAASSSLESLTVRGDVVSGGGKASGAISGQTIGPVKIGGSLLSSFGTDSATIVANQITSVTIGGEMRGSGPGSGSIRAGGAIGFVKIAGDVTGGNPESGSVRCDSIGSLDIGGSLVGAGGKSSGQLNLGDAQRVSIRGDLSGGAGTQSGNVIASSIHSLTIGGSVLGGPYDDAGRVFVEKLDSAFIGGDLRGQNGDHSGEVRSTLLGTLTIRGSIIGGTAPAASGDIVAVHTGSIFVGGDVQGGSTTTAAQTRNFTGAITAFDLQKLTIGGSLIAGTQTAGSTLTNSGAIVVSAHLGDVLVRGSIVGNATQTADILVRGQSVNPLVLESLTVNGGVHFANILAGYDGAKVPVTPDVQIGAIKAGSWEASNLAAGVTSGGNLQFGDADDTPIAGGQASIVSRIASITIKGQLFGTVGGSDHYGFVAERIGAVSLGEVQLPFTPAKNLFDLGSTLDVAVREI